VTIFVLRRLVAAQFWAPKAAFLGLVRLQSLAKHALPLILALYALPKRFQEEHMPRQKKQAQDVNKSEAIREALREMGLDASPTEVAQRLGKQGIDVRANAVSMIKLRMRKQGDTRPQRPAARSTPNASASSRAGGNGSGQVELGDVLAVNEIASKIGTANLKSLVASLPV
jgi:hypothetical protein